MARHEGQNSSGKRHLTGAWRRAAARATQCEGAIDLDELRACGLTAEQVWHATRTGRLFRRHRGVYLMGHEFATARARLFLRVKACGPRAVISHVSAAAFWGFLEWDGRLHVTVPTRRRPRSFAVLHRRRLDPRTEVVHRRGFAVTPIGLTLADCACTLAEPLARAIVEQADQQQKLSPRTVRAARAAVAGRSGEELLNTLLDVRDPGRGRPKGWLEKRWARFAKEWELPPYARGSHIDIGGLDLREMDVYFPPTATRAARIFELDGYTTHDRSKAAFARDRRRDRRLVAAGIGTVRVTELDFDDEPELAEDAFRFLGDHARADAIARGEWRPARSL